MPPQRSEVWKHFTMSADKKNAKCNICTVELTYAGTTTNLRNHLRMKHSTFVNISDEKTAKKQAPMSMFLKSTKKSDSEQR